MAKENVDKTYIDGKFICYGHKEAVHINEKANYKLNILYDSDAQNSHDYTDTIQYFANTRDYNHDNLSIDELTSEDCSLCDGVDKFVSKLNERDKDLYKYYPIYGYIHSGVSISLEPFSCRFDSGLFAIARVCISQVDDPNEAIKADVELMNNWYNGNCFGYSISNEEGHTVDSCFGFIGDYEDVKKMIMEGIQDYGFTEEEIDKAFDNIIY